MATATYTREKSAFGRRVQWLVELELDRCTLTYGTSPCTAAILGDGLRCHYSYPTCQLPTAFNRGTRVLRFFLNEVPWDDPSSALAFPYLDSIVSTPQEIDPSKLFTYPEKITLRMLRDYTPIALDADKAAGRFNTTNAGEFWRNLFARNRNYANRPVRLYRGFQTTDFELADFERVGPEYLLRSVEYGDRFVELMCESPLVKLNEASIPAKTSEDNIIVNASPGASGRGIDASETTLEIVRAIEIPDPTARVRTKVYVKLEDEICEVTARDTGANELTIVRGRLGTTASQHPVSGDWSQTVKAEVIEFFGVDNGAGQPSPQYATDTIQDLIELAGVDAADIDDASFDYVRDSVWPTPNIFRIVTKSEKISKHLRPLRETVGIIVYINADGKFACKALAPIYSSSKTIDEDIAVSKKSGPSVSVVENDEERITRVSFWYDPTTENPGQDAKDYNKGVLVIAADLEQPNNYGDVKDALRYDAWLDPSSALSVVRNTARRLIARLRAGTRTFHFDLEVRDSELNVGDAVSIGSRDLVDATGVPIMVAAIILGKKEVERHVTRYWAIDVDTFNGKAFRIAPDSLQGIDYDSATSANKLYGWWGDSDNRLGDQFDTGYVWW